MDSNTYNYLSNKAGEQFHVCPFCSKELDEHEIENHNCKKTSKSLDEIFTLMEGKMTDEKTKPLNLHQRLLLIMSDVSYVQKEDKKVNNQYTFVSHDAVVKKIRESMVKNRVIAIPRYFNHDHEITNSERYDNNAKKVISVINVFTRLSLDVQYVNPDNPSESITTTTYGYGIDPQDKGVGKAQSYAMKYNLLKTFMLETGDDPERDSIDYKTKESTPENKKEQTNPNGSYQTPPASDKQKKYIRTLCGKIRVTHLQNLPLDEYLKTVNISDAKIMIDKLAKTVGGQ